MNYTTFTLGTLKHRWTSWELFKYRLKHFKNCSLNSQIIWESKKTNDSIYDVGESKYDNWFVHEIIHHKDSNIVDIYIAKSDSPKGDIE